MPPFAAFLVSSTKRHLAWAPFTFDSVVHKAFVCSELLPVALPTLFVIGAPPRDLALAGT